MVGIMATEHRLKYAREKAGLTQQEAAQRSGIGPSSLSEFESGKREPRLIQLHKLAELYRRSVAFFIEEGPLPAEVVLWREKPQPLAEQEIATKFLRLCEQYHNLEVWCGEKRSAELPVAKGDANAYKMEDTENLAYELRRTLGLGDRPGSTLPYILEEVYGVKVFHVPLGVTGCAACSRSDTFGLAVLLNSDAISPRRNFDLAHELFHLLTWNVFRKTSDQDSVVANGGEEILANLFASHLLMPTEPVRRAVNPLIAERRTTLSCLYDVARQFDVSLEALLWRVKDVYALGEEKIREALEQSRKSVGVWEVRESAEAPLRSKRFLALARKACRMGEMSLGRFAEYTGLTRADAMRYSEKEIHEDVAIEIAT